MLTKTVLKVFAMLVVLSAVAVISFNARAGADEPLKELAGYRQWASVKGEPGKITLVPASTSLSVEALAVAD